MLDTLNSVYETQPIYFEKTERPWQQAQGEKQVTRDLFLEAVKTLRKPSASAPLYGFLLPGEDGHDAKMLRAEFGANVVMNGIEKDRATHTRIHAQNVLNSVYNENLSQFLDRECDVVRKNDGTFKYVIRYNDATRKRNNGRRFAPIYDFAFFDLTASPVSKDECLRDLSPPVFDRYGKPIKDVRRAHENIEIFVSAMAARQSIIAMTFMECPRTMSGDLEDLVFQTLGRNLQDKEYQKFRTKGVEQERAARKKIEWNTPQMISDTIKARLLRQGYVSDVSPLVAKRYVAQKDSQPMHFLMFRITKDVIRPVDKHE